MFTFSMENLEQKDQKGWVGCDLDGTLAKYDGFKGWDNIGEPIQKTVDLVKSIMDQGVEVRILTARASAVSRALNSLSFEQVEEVIQKWTLKHLGMKLRVVTEKDAFMYFFIDDSAVQIEKNTGNILGKMLPLGEKQPEPIIDYDDADVNGQTNPNEEKLTEEQIVGFCTGMVNGGFKEAEQIDCGGTQCCIEAKMDTNVTRVCLDTFKGNLTNEETTLWLRTDIVVALGSNRFMFKLPNLDFKTLGEWIAKKVLQWNNK